MGELVDLFSNGIWYQCVEYDGMVSNGVYDLRGTERLCGIPSKLAGMDILDVGCSDGYYSLRFALNGAKSVVGIDRNQYDGTIPVAISNSVKSSYQIKYQKYCDEYETFRLIYQYYSLSNSNKFLLMQKITGLPMHFENGDIMDLSKYECKFDLVFCGSLLEHLRDPFTAVEQLFRVLRKGGKMILAVSSPILFPRIVERILFPLFSRFPIASVIGGGQFLRLGKYAAMRLCELAGFSNIREFSRFSIINRKFHYHVPLLVLHADRR